MVTLHLLLSYTFIFKDKIHTKNFFPIANIAAASISVAHAFGRLGCLMAGCCHGAETDAWYGVYFVYYEIKAVPIQLFEAIFLFLMAGAAFYAYFKCRKRPHFPTLFPCYLIVYGVWRFFIEFARADDRGQTIIPFLTPSQLIAVLLIGVGIGYLIVWYIIKSKKRKKEAINGTDGSNEGV